MSLNYLYVDSREVYLAKIAETELADRVYFHWDTYWKSPEYLIRPREQFTPLMLYDLRNAHPIGGRDYEGGRGLVLSPEYGLVHHLSYVGPDERIYRKITTWGHRTEVLDGWYENVWQRWDGDKLQRNLHPTYAPAYGVAERIPVSDLLQPTMARYRELTGESEREPLPRPARWLKLSVIIPLHGGTEDIRTCLDSLQKSQDLLHEVIIADNASPDDAPEVAATYPFVTIVRHETNRGFSAACNLGASVATGEVLLFLNSDTLVPRPALIRLLESLLQSGSIAATGPYSNRVGHFQQLTPSYNSFDHLDLFAEDFAHRTATDVETDMLVGFCIAVRRSVWEEIGGFDERFGLGTYEDTDLCYRMRRAGYRLVISARSFIHHHGSKTLTRVSMNVRALMAENEAKYRQKWREDLTCGFASHLSGLSAERIVFDPTRHPDQRKGQLAERVRRADISLCMIVKNEERVLRDCLESAKPFFREMLVVDTGSTDSTIEIARACGAKVYEIPWPDSFALARNESLKHAQGKWIFWLDADDTLPFSSGEAILEAASSAPTHVHGFVVPVQFVEEGVGKGTRVDHVKLFRNLPHLAFEGRIHEQILPSLRQHGGEIQRCPALVLHSGYDTSPQGQARKRERDLYLLQLDLADRPGHPFVLFNLGMTHHYLGNHHEAVGWLRECLSVSPPDNSHVRKAYSLLAVSLRELGDKEGALTVLEEGLSHTAEDPELHFHAGHLLTTLERLEEAKQHYLQTLSADISNHFSSVDTGIMGYKTFHNLGSLCNLMGNYPEARTWWQKAMEGAPQFTPSLFEWFHAALTAGDTHTAHRLLHLVQDAEGASESWANMGLHYAEAVGGTANAEDFLRRTVHAQPENLAVRRVLVQRLLEQGREREAEPHLAYLDERGSAESAFYRGVSAIRRGDLRTALQWMERSWHLNPEHEETKQQVLNLRKALGISTQSTSSWTGFPKEVLPLAEQYPYPTEKPNTPPEEHGWLQSETASVLAEHLSEHTHIILELGAWLGRSTRFLCHSAPHATVITVDHWLGSEDMKADPTLSHLLPYLYETFLVNCWDYRDRIIPVRATTQVGMEQVAQLGIQPDLIYIDASHDKESVTQDVLTALNLFPNTTLVGDDWNSVGVPKALEAIVGELRLEARFGHNEVSWWLLAEEPPVSLDLRTAIEQIAQDLSLNAEELYAYTQEDTVGGYNLKESTSANPHWQGGSVWEVEGQILYALVRALKPETVVEIGSLRGCSASHLALACQHNGKGKVYAVDPYLDFSQLASDLLTHIVPVKEDAFQWMPPQSIDLLFEDGMHTRGFTGAILERYLPHCGTSSLILCHDAYTKHLSRHVFGEFSKALPGAKRVLIRPSNCGLGYVRHVPIIENKESSVF